MTDKLSVTAERYQTTYDSFWKYVHNDLILALRNGGGPAPTAWSQTWRGIATEFCAIFWALFCLAATVATLVCYFIGGIWACISATFGWDKEATGADILGTTAHTPAMALWEALKVIFYGNCAGNPARFEPHPAVADDGI